MTFHFISREPLSSSSSASWWHPHLLRGGSTSRHPVLWADTSRQCAPWSVALRRHRVEMRQDLIVHVSTTWALACAETIQQCPGMMRQVETRLLNSKVAYKLTIDHSSWRPVFIPLRSLVDRSCVCPDRASSYKSFCGWSNTSAYRGQFGWALSNL